jgi:hypothetical protein
LRRLLAADQTEPLKLSPVYTARALSTSTSHAVSVDFLAPMARSKPLSRRSVGAYALLQLRDRPEPVVWHGGRAASAEAFRFLFHSMIELKNHAPSSQGDSILPSYLPQYLNSPLAVHCERPPPMLRAYLSKHIAPGPLFIPIRSSRCWRETAASNLNSSCSIRASSWVCMLCRSSLTIVLLHSGGSNSLVSQSHRSLRAERFPVMDHNLP